MCRSSDFKEVSKVVDKKGKKRLIVVTAILIAALGFLVFTNLRSSAYMLTINEVQDNPKYIGSMVRVGGLVVKDTIERKGKSYRFKIADKGKEMLVDYSGSMPSTFGPNIQVIALGKLISKEKLEAREIVTKCPSKYQSKVDKPGTEGKQQ